MRRNENRAEGQVCRPALWMGMLLSSASLSLSCASLARSEQFQPGRQAGIVQSDRLREISGLAASRRHPGVLYVHNDSDDASRVYAINAKAELLGVCTLRGAAMRDWEDIAVGPGPDPNQQYLYIGDIGDNGAKRPEIVVYRVPEPKVDATTPFNSMTLGPAEAIRLLYPDGPRDAETLLVDPPTRDIYLISKRDLTPRVYRAAFPQSTTQPTKLEPVFVLPLGLFPTGGAVSPDGRRVLVRGMSGVVLWLRPPDKPLWHAFRGDPVSLPVASEPQGEAISFDREGTGYFTISEGTHPRLYYFAPAEPNVP